MVIWGLKGETKTLSISRGTCCGVSFAVMTVKGRLTPQRSLEILGALGAL